MSGAFAEDERVEIRRLAAREIEDTRERLHVLLHDSVVSAKESEAVQKLVRPYYEAELRRTYMRLKVLMQIMDRTEAVAA